MTTAQQALKHITEKNLKPTNMSSAELSQVAIAARQKAFFSARVGNLQFLDRARDLTTQIVAGDLDRATARADLKKLLKKLNYEPLPGEAGSVQDLSSDRRLNLILDTNVDQARNHGIWQKSQQPEILAIYPCQELVRVGSMPAAPRPWKRKWVLAGGKLYEGRLIARKDDPIWMKTISNGGFNRFGTPYPPFDFQSGMRVRNISRREALKLGVIKKDTQIQPRQSPDFAKTQVSKTSLSAAARKALMKHYGSMVKATPEVIKLAPIKSVFPVGHFDEDIPKLKDLQEALSEQEFASLEKYTTRAHVLINNYLRAGKLPNGISDKARADLLQTIDKASAGILKYKGFKDDTTLYRSVNLPKPVLDKILKDQLYIDKAFLSSTFDPSGNPTRNPKKGEQSLLVRILVSKGSRGLIPIENLSVFPGQLEVLFLPSSVFRVESYRDNVLSVTYLYE